LEWNWLKWFRIYYIKVVIILKRIKDKISGQSIKPNNNLWRHFKGKSIRNSPISDRLRKLKILLEELLGGLWILNLNETK